MSKRSFAIGLGAGLTFFVGANIYSYHAAKPPCCDGFASFGFPLQFGSYGGYFGHTGFDVPLLLADSIISLCVSLAVSWLFAKMVPIAADAFHRMASWHARTRL